MDGYVQIGTKLDTKDFDAEIKYVESQLEEIEYKLKQADMGFNVGDTEKLEAQYSRLVKQLDRLQKKQADFNKSDLTKIQKSIDKIGDSTSKTIRNIGKWALAVFGVRSAYMFVRQSASTLAQYNEKIASDLEYMRFALASGLQPVIESLIQLCYRLLNYVNYIANAWFGVNLFANASADAMNKSVKSAQQMKRSLAGFDEMNVAGSQSGGATSGLPSVDLSTIQGDVPSWILWIAENKDIVLAGLTGIAGGLLAIQLGLTAIQGLGIGLALTGIIILVQGIIDFLNDPSWNNFLTILQGIALVVGGIAILCGAWTIALVSLGVAIVTSVIENWDKVKVILGSVGGWIYENVVKPVGNFFVGLWNGFKNGAQNSWDGITETFSKISGWINNNVVKPVKGWFDGLWESLKAGPKGFANYLIQTVEGLINKIIQGVNWLIKQVNKFSFDVPDWVPEIGGKKMGFNIKKVSEVKLPRLNVGGIVNMPGRGVPVGGALTGEVRKEGVIPLTNSQAMEELGASIGKYITINANIVNTMNGRVISRELQKINNSNDFAYNK